MSHMQIYLRDLLGAGEPFGAVASLEMWEGLSPNFRGEASRTFHKTTEWAKGRAVTGPWARRPWVSMFQNRTKVLSLILWGMPLGEDPL